MLDNLKLPRSGRQNGAGRILFLGLETYGLFGGIQRFNQRLIAAAIRVSGGGNFFAVLSRDTTETIPPEVARVVCGTGVDRRLFILTALRESRKSDVILLGHVNLLPIGIFVKLLRPRLQLVLLVHGDEVWNDPVFRIRPWYELFLARFVSRIAAVSAYTARVMAVEYRLAPERFAVFPNTVDLNIDEFHVAEQPPYFLLVSRLDSHDNRKNVDQVIRAMARLPDHLSEARLEIVGDGVLRANLEKLVAAEGLEERVHFNGRATNTRLEVLYRGASVFVLPSTKEGFGIVYLEAWQHLLPVICANIGGAPEVVSDGIDGFVVDAENLEMLTNRMADLLSKPELAHSMGAAGASKLRERYSTEVLDRNFAALIHDQLK